MTLLTGDLFPPRHHRLSVTGKGLLEVARGTLKVSGVYTYLDIEDRRLETKVLLELDR